MLNYEQKTRFLDDIPSEQFWSKRDNEQYRGDFLRFAIKNTKRYLSLIELYGEELESPGYGASLKKKTEFLLWYLREELDKMPLTEWAKTLSLGIHGNPKGLRRLERMALQKLKNLNKIV